MLVTTSEAPPPPSAMRLVPKVWTRPLCISPVLAWDNRGCGGREGSLWAAGEGCLLHAVSGYDAPCGLVELLPSFGKGLRGGEILTPPDAGVGAEGGAEGRAKPATPAVDVPAMFEYQQPDHEAGSITPEDNDRVEPVLWAEQRRRSTVDTNRRRSQIKGSVAEGLAAGGMVPIGAGSSSDDDSSDAEPEMAFTSVEDLRRDNT